MRITAVQMVLTVVVSVSGCNSSSSVCGDGFCEPSSGESCSTCSVDCGSCASCGDGVCDPGTGESCMSCQVDCGPCAPTCGNGTCDGGESCTSCPGDCGSCMTTCDATTCGGCCDGDACLSGNSPAGCGSGGNVCMVCDSAFTCSAGACVVDGASRWNVVLEQLSVSDQNAAGAAWDGFGGAPDPYVLVRIGSETATPSRSGSGSDTFSVRFTGGAVASNVRADSILTHIDFTVMDEDATSDDVVGRCRVSMTDAAFNEATQTMNCPRDTAGGQAGFMLSWHLTRF